MKLLGKYMATKKQYNKIMDALNLIDEQAEHGNTEHDEDVARAEAYNTVADFIKEMADKRITIHFSEEDLRELESGEEFNWTFNGVDVHLFKGHDDEDGTVCTKCGNPVIMYWCNECEANHEEEACCPACGGKSIVDKKYHKECN